MFEPKQIRLFATRVQLLGFEKLGIDVELYAKDALVGECIHRKMEDPGWEGYNWYFDTLMTIDGDKIFLLQNFKPGEPEKELGTS